MDVLARTKELLSSLVDVTESGSMIARYKIEVANIERKLGVLLRRAGERAWQIQTESRTDVLGDADVQAAFDEVRRLRARMEVIRQDIERNRSRAVDEARKAARILKAGAVAVAKKAVDAKLAARRKSGKETTDLQG